MKRKLTILLCAASFYAIQLLAQNVPVDGGSYSSSVITAIPGSITNTVSLPTPYSLGSNPNFNYVRIFVPQTPVTNEASITESSSPAYLKMSTSYLDGLGRKLQTITRNSSPTTDLVTPFDSRPSTDHFSYLPYSIGTTATNTFQMSPFTDQGSYYNSLFPAEPGMAVGESSYTSDALSRVAYNFAPGKSNLGQKNGVRSTSITNVANEVIIWEIDPSTGWPLKVGYYDAGSLIKKVTETADGAQVFEYYDNEGKLLAKNVLSGFTDCDLTLNTASIGSVAAFRMYNPAEDPTLVPNSETTHEGESPQTPSFANREIPTNYFSPFRCPTYLLTYYVYDVYDRLTYVMPPKAVQYLYANAWVANATIISNLCDRNVYDDFGRIVETHQAGEIGNNQFIYDNHDRVMATKKPNDFDWWWNHYDAFNRVIETGVVSLSASRTVVQGWFDNTVLPTAYNTPTEILYFLYNENQQGVYTTSALSSATTINAYNFYDDYSHSTFFDGTTTQSISLPSYASSAYGSYTLTGPAAIAPVQSNRTLGLLTGSVSKVFMQATISTLDHFVYGSNYYDDHGRLLESIDKNTRSGIDYFANQYDFSGKLLLNIEQINNPSCTANTITTSITGYQYNPYTQNLTQVTNSMNGAAAKTIASYTYNALGQITLKGIGGVEVQGMAYNLRRQLTGINPDFAENGNDGGLPVTFGESIKYDAGFGHNLLCGGIAGIIWKDKGFPSRAYGYTYDNAGRLKQADFTEYTSVPISYMGGSGFVPPPSWTKTYTDYTEGNYNYDWNGNLTKLDRYGPVLNVSTGSISPGKIDELTYTYLSSDISNQIKQVDDGIPATTTTYTPYDFKDNNNTTDYAYDNNGSLSVDLNKSVSITYNHFGKPDKKVFANGDEMDYAYDCAGNKLAELYSTPGSGASSTSSNIATDYIGNMQYEQTSTSFGGPNLKLANNQEGYTVPNGSAFDYFYFIRDHLGNVRNVQNMVEVPIDAAPNPGYVFSYFAGHEPLNAVSEEAVFSNIPKVRDDKPESCNEQDLKAAHLDAADPDRVIGTAIVLKVMPGDRFDIEAESYYSSSDLATGTIDNSQLVNALLNTLATGSGGIANGETGQINTLQSLFTPDNLGMITSIQASGNVDSTRPLSFINYILYDDNFNIVPEQSGSIQIGGEADAWQTIGSSAPIAVGRSGYLTVFMSTSTGGIATYLDRFSLHHYIGNTQDIKHYYPYGLTATSSVAATTAAYPFENRYLYQTQEYDKREGLYVYDFNAREYDPQLGRFQSLDAANQFSSGYTGMGNNPISMVDPSGNEAGEEEDLPGFSNRFEHNGNMDAMDEYFQEGTPDPFDPTSNEPYDPTGGGDPTYGFGGGGSNGDGNSGADLGLLGSMLNLNSGSTNLSLTHPSKFSGANNSGTQSGNSASFAFVGAAALATGWTADAIDPEPISKAAGAIGMTCYTGYALYENRYFLAYSTDALYKKMTAEIERIMIKAGGPQGVQYALVAVQNGYYPNVRGGTTLLKAGEVYKYGETTNSQTRYSRAELVQKGLRFVPQFAGNKVAIKIQEKVMIYNYFISNGSLPPGNSIFR